MRKKVFFRADAGPRIGYGHFIRTLALADMLKDEFDCTFFTQSPTDYQKMEAQSICPLIPLPSDESKFSLFLSYLRGDEIVVLDNYFFTSDYQMAIKERGCRLVCIDDVHDRHFYADVIINHGIEDYSLYDAEDYTRFFMGGKWALLRSPFRRRDESIERNDNHWVITFGGSDPNNLTLKYVNYLRSRIPNCRISLLLGDGYAFFDEVEQIPHVTIYCRQSAEQVAALFRSARYVICSASSVCYEALACGCLVSAGFYVDNQKDFYYQLVDSGMISPLGDLRKGELILDIESTSCGTLDFTRIADSYRLLFGALRYEVVPYPRMTHAQSCTTWECRNKSEIRMWMTNPNPFDFSSHSAFVESLRDHETKLYFSFFDGERFVGSYDFVDIKSGFTAEHGLFVNPDAQGKGVASMMEILMDGEIRKRGVKTILAEVLKHNEKSYHYHLKLGYEVYKEDEQFFYLKRDI